MACKICMDVTMTLDRVTGEMTCPNGHQNYIGSPDNYKPSDTIYNKKTGEFERTGFMDNTLFDNLEGSEIL